MIGPFGRLGPTPQLDPPTSGARRTGALPSEGRGHRFESCRVRQSGTKPGTPSLFRAAAANAAFAVIKQAVSNGKEIAAAGSAIAEFVGAKEKLQQRAQRKGGGSDLEEFMALEKIKEQEEQLKQIMIYAGRPGLWHDWQKFQAKARIARREAEQERRKKRRHHFEVAAITFMLIVVACVLAAIVLLILHHQGRL